MARFVFGPVAAWFAAAIVASGFGLFRGTGSPPWVLGVFVLGPIVGFVSLYRSNSGARRAFDALPLGLLTAAHAWRFVGALFVLGVLLGRLPAQFGYPAGYGDLVAAAAALPLAFLVSRRPNLPGLRPWFVAWNLFGLVDLLVAISLGILYSPGRLGLLRETISTRLLTELPGSVIPTFFVPLFILAHLLGMRRSGELAAGAGAPREATP